LLCFDQWLLDEQQRLDAFDLVDDVLHQPIGHVLEHHRLERERGRTDGLGALDQRASPQRLDRLQDRAAAGARAEGSQQRGQAHRLAFHRHSAQHLLLEGRAALDLLSQEPPNTPEDATCGTMPTRPRWQRNSVRWRVPRR